MQKKQNLNYDCFLPNTTIAITTVALPNASRIILPEQSNINLHC